MEVAGWKQHAWRTAIRNGLDVKYLGASCYVHGSALIDYVKRGRDAGLSLAMATQQPSAVDDRILSQVNLSFSHRLTFQADITASVHRIPTKLLRD